MVSFRCLICGHTDTLATIPNTCPNCGADKKKIKLLEFTLEFHYPGVAYPVYFINTTILGRNHFRTYGDGYKYMQEEQFKVIKIDNGWKITGCPSKNPTNLNGVDTTGKEINLKDGDIIEIGLIKLQAKLIEIK